MSGELKNTKGKIRLRFQDGSYKDFENSEEAQKWLTENKHHIVEQIKPKEFEFPEQEISTPKSTKGLSHLQGTAPNVNTPSDFSALFGDSRIKGVQKVLQRNPHALDNYNIFNNVMDFYRIGSGGLLNRLSPTQNLRFLYDVVTGENIGDSWLGNHGIVSDEFAQEHPYLSMLANTIGDLGSLYGISRTNAYLNGYKPIGEGASSKVYVSNSPFKRKYVYKVSNTTPEEMTEIGNLPRTVKSEYLGKWTDGTHIYKQERVTPTTQPRDPKTFDRLAKSRGFLKYIFPGDTEMVYYNPQSNQVMLDLVGNWGVDRLGRTVLFDPSVLSKEDYLSLLRKGGKINQNNFPIFRQK